MCLSGESYPACLSISLLTPKIPSHILPGVVGQGLHACQHTGKVERETVIRRTGEIDFGELPDFSGGNMEKFRKSLSTCLRTVLPITAVIDGRTRSHDVFLDAVADEEHEKAVFAVGETGIITAFANNVHRYQFHPWTGIELTDPGRQRTTSVKAAVLIGFGDGIGQLPVWHTIVECIRVAETYGVRCSYAEHFLQVIR